MALKQKTYLPNSKGFTVAGENEGLIQPTFALELRNARVTKNSEVEKRRGRTKLNTTAFPGAPTIKNIITYEGDFVSDYESLAYGNTELRKFDEGTLSFPTLVHSGITTGNKFSVTTFNGKIILSNGLDTMFKYGYVGPPSAAPTTGTTTSGSLAARTYYVKTTYVSSQIDQSHTTQDGSLNFGDVAANLYRSQGFTAGNTSCIHKISLKLKKVGLPVDNLQVSIRATSSGEPTGADLTNLATLDLSTLKTEYEWHDISFTTYAPLTSGTVYCIYITRSGGVDATNYVLIGDDTAAGYSGGSSFNSSDGSTWNAVAGVDTSFKTFMLSGETKPSDQSVQAVPLNDLLTVTSPVATEGAVAYNVYASETSSSEVKQTEKPVVIATNFTEDSAGLASHGAIPATNSAWYVQDLLQSPLAKYIFVLNSRVQSGGIEDRPTQWKACSAGNEDDWTTVGDAIDIDLTSVLAKGDEIVGLSRHGPTGELILAMKNHIVTYSVPELHSNIQVQSVVNNVGCLSHWSAAEVGEDTYLMDKSGANSVRRELLIQGFKSKKLSENIEDRLIPLLADLSDPTEVTAVNFKQENEYLITIPSQNRRYVYNYALQAWMEDRDITIYDQAVTPDGFLLSAGENGFVYREYQDSSRNDVYGDGNDDTDVAFRWDTPWLWVDDVSIKKAFRYFQFKGTGSGHFTLKVYFDFVDTAYQTINLQSYPTLWDEVLWDVPYWDFPDINKVLIPMLGRGRAVKFSFECDHQEDLSISYYGVKYIAKGFRGNE